MVFGGGSARGQRVYADAATAAGTTPTVVSNPTYSQGASTSLPPTSTLPTKLFAKGTNGGALAPGTPQSGYLELRFTGGTSTSNAFLKVANAFISGSGSSVSYALYNNTTPVASNTSSITATDGSTLIVIAGTSAFDRIRITATGGGGAILGGAGGTAAVDIYYGFFNNTLPSDCGQGLATTGSGTLGATATDLINAIDGSITSKSTLALGILLSSAEQTVYFSGASTVSDVLKFTVSVPPALLSASVLNNITISAYNGSSNTPVWSTGLGSVLGLDLLNSLNTGAPITTSVAPNVLFDRVTISFSAAVSVLSLLHIHEIERVPTVPILAPPSSQNATICSGSPATLTASAPNSGNEIRWYDSAVGGTLLYTGNPFTPSPTTTTTYYLAIGKIGCSTESERIPVIVIVNPLPTITLGSIVDVCQGNISGSLPYSATSGSPTTYKIVWKTAANAANFIDVPYTALTSSPLTFPIPTNPAAATYTGSVIVKNTNTCESTSFDFNITIHTTPTAPHIVSQ